MPHAHEKLALHLLKPEFNLTSSFSRTMPHIHVTHPCVPDSPKGLDNPVFVVDDCKLQHSQPENEKHVYAISGTTPTPERSCVQMLSLKTHSLPVSPTPRVWDQLSFVSTPSHSISEASSSMNAEKGLFIYEKIHAIVKDFGNRAQRVKERIMQPPTPSSLDSRRSMTPSMEFVNRHRFESFVTFASSIQSNPHQGNDGCGFVQEYEWKRWWYKFANPCLLSSRRRCIDPQSRVYILWLALVSVCYLYNSWSVVLRSSFPYQTSENLYCWMLADYTADLVYLLDIIMWKPYIRVLQDGFWINDPKKTSRIYWISWIFKLDLLSLLPLDLFYFYYGFCTLLRLPRMLKINTFWEFFDRFDRAARLPHVIRILHTLSYMLFLIHVNACAYYAYSDYEGIGRPDNVWVYNGEGNAYIRCFLFATKIATSIGKNPMPTHEGEFMFMTFSWLSGVFIFAMLIGQIRDTLSVASQNEEEYRKIMDRTIVYMKRLNLMKELHTRTRIWFNYNWQQQKSLDEYKHLRILPRKMQMDIAMCVHFNILSKVELFQDFERNLLRELVLKLKPYLYLPGDYICLKGEVGKEMYIVNYGKVEVLGGANNVVMATLIEGSVFGEISLLSLGFGNRRTADVRSKGFSNLFVLSKSDLHATIKDYPLAQDILRHRAKILIKKAVPRVPLQDDVKSSQSSNCISQTVANINNRTPTPKLVQTVLQVVPEQSLTAYCLGRHSHHKSRGYPNSAPPDGPRVLISTPSNDLSATGVVSDAKALTSEQPSANSCFYLDSSSHPKSRKLPHLKKLNNFFQSDSPESFDNPNRDYSSRPRSGPLYDVEAYLESGPTSKSDSDESDSASVSTRDKNVAQCSVIIHNPSAPRIN